MAYLFSQDVSQETVKEHCSNHMMKITIIHPNVAQENQDPELDTLKMSAKVQSLHKKCVFVFFQS